MVELKGELKAMAEVEAALEALDEEARSRVMQWANSKFRAAGKPGTGGRPSIDEGSGADSSSDDYSDLATFFDAANPSNDAEKALVGAYWMQYREEASEIEAQAVNTKLKHLGHGIGNVTRAFEALKSERPSLLVQTKKDGSTKQARKKFKVTAEGKKRVEALLRRD